MTGQESLQAKLQALHKFSACDVSDALLKLEPAVDSQTPKAGFQLLTDVVPFAPKSPFSGDISEQPKIVAPASTLQLVPKGAPLDTPDERYAIPKGTHWVDLTEEGSVLVIEQPPTQTCAAIGGIMALRMKARAVKAAVIGGRVRDLAELRDSKLPVWACASSAVGTNAESKVRARNIPITVRGVRINAGDIIFCDPLEGVVVIPFGLLDEVLNLMPKLVEADEKVKEDVLHGASVFDAFKKHR